MRLQRIVFIPPLVTRVLTPFHRRSSRPICHNPPSHMVQTASKRDLMEASIDPLDAMVASSPGQREAKSGPYFSRSSVDVAVTRTLVSEHCNLLQANSSYRLGEENRLEIKRAPWDAPMHPRGAKH